jgi:hypothetical protein
VETPAWRATSSMPTMGFLKAVNLSLGRSYRPEEARRSPSVISH